MRYTGTLVEWSLVVWYRDNGEGTGIMVMGHWYMHQVSCTKGSGSMGTLKVCNLLLFIVVVYCCLVETTRLILEGKNPTHLQNEQGKTFDVSLKCIDDSGQHITIGKVPVV